MASLSESQQALLDVWEAHTAAEFEQKDADAAIATMTDHPVLIHVPVGTGATGRDAVRKFYAEVLIPQTPPDIELQCLTQSICENCLIEELILRFTHTVRMDWFAPGVEPTGRSVAVPIVAVISFEGRKISSEHIYWDHATVLAQMGLLGDDLPLLGAAQCDRLLNADARQSN